MTCIVGIAQDGAVWLGGDSAGASGYHVTVRADQKVFCRHRRGDQWVFGFTSSFRMGQLIHHSLTLPEGPDNGDDIHAFLATTFIDAVRRCLSDGGWMGKDDNRDEGGTFLIGYRSRLFIVYSDFQVAESADGFAAVGCGEQFALGALHATGGQSAEQRVRTALDAAARFSGGVCGPFRLEHLESA